MAFILDADTIRDLSIENVYHHLRFNDNAPKDALIKLAYMPLRENASQFLTAYNNGSLFIELAKMPLPTPDTKTTKTIEQIMDIYYLETDRYKALDLLEQLISIQPTSPKHWETYMETIRMQIKAGFRRPAPLIYNKLFI